MGRKPRVERTPEEKWPGDRQTITIPALDSSYCKFPLRFVAKGDSDDARIEITGQPV